MFLPFVTLMAVVARLFGNVWDILAPLFANKTVEANTSTTGCSLISLAAMIDAWSAWSGVPSSLGELRATLIKVERSGSIMTQQGKRRSFVGNSPYHPSARKILKGYRNLRHNVNSCACSMRPAAWRRVVGDTLKHWCWGGKKNLERSRSDVN